MEIENMINRVKGYIKEKVKGYLKDKKALDKLGMSHKDYEARLKQLVGKWGL